MNLMKKMMDMNPEIVISSLNTKIFLLGVIIPITTFIQENNQIYYG